jgi:hypothetical protein
MWHRLLAGQTERQRSVDLVMARLEAHKDLVASVASDWRASKRTTARPSRPWAGSLGFPTGNPGANRTGNRSIATTTEAGSSGAGFTPGVVSPLQPRKRAAPTMPRAHEKR